MHSLPSATVPCNQRGDAIAYTPPPVAELLFLLNQMLIAYPVRSSW